MKTAGFVEYEISGRNLPLLIKKLENESIPIMDMRQVGQCKVRIKTLYSKRADFERICSACYSPKRVATGGLGAKIGYLFKKIGAIIGAIVFTLACYYADGFVLDVKITGSGEFNAEVYEVLERENIKKYSRFSSFDCNDLAQKIYLSNALICYAGVKKSGTTLCVRVEKSEVPVKKIDTNLTSLKCDCDGEVYSITVYRGIAQKGVGDKVYVGDVLVSGYEQNEDYEYSGYVLATVKVLCAFEYEYKSETFGEKEISLAVISAKNACGLDEYHSKEVKCSKGVIIVKLYYLKTFGG